MVNVEQRDRLKRYLLSKGIRAEETDKMIYFEQYKKIEQRINRRRIIFKSILVALVVAYSAINYDKGYLPVKNMVDQGKSPSQIEEIIDKSYNPILNGAVTPGKKLAYLFNAYKLEMKDNK